MAGMKRERQLARERWERQQARRAELDARRRHRRKQLVLGLIGLLVLSGIGLGIYALVTREGSVTANPGPQETQQPEQPATAGPDGVACTFNESGDASKDAGLPPASAPAEPYTATLKLSQGTVKFTALAQEAPCTTRSFRHLASKNYFSDTSCHRLTTEGLFVLQCGDPTGTGTGGPGYAFKNENVPPDGNYPAGTVAMANSGGQESNGSQFFLVYKDTQLPANYTVFGRITEGLDVLEKIGAKGVEGGQPDGKPAEAVRLEAVTTSAP